MCLSKEDIKECEDHCWKSKDFEVFATKTLKQTQDDSSCITEKALSFGKGKVRQSKRRRITGEA